MPQDPARAAADGPASKRPRDARPAQTRASERRLAEPKRVEPRRVASAEVSRAAVSVRYAPAHYARIYVDGEHVNPSTPIFEGSRPLGHHKVVIESDSCERWEREFDLGPEGMPVQALLTRKPALLSVRSSQKDLGIMITGVFRGTAGESEKDPIAVPLPEGALKGPLSVRLFRAGFRDDVRTLTVTAGQVTPVQVELEKE